jgi:hypothetical protein
MLPIVLARITSKKLNFPCATRNPANGMTNSEGTGTTILSNIIRIKIPLYPNSCIVERAKLPINAKISVIIDMDFLRKNMKYYLYFILYFFLEDYRLLKSIHKSKKCFFFSLYF